MHALAILGLVVALSLPTLAVPHTVDDSNTHWMYSGGIWNAVTPSSPCIGCSLRPDPDLALGATWHDTTDRSTAQLSFTGVSIEIYIIYYTDGPFNITITLGDTIYAPIDILSNATSTYIPHLAFAKRSLPLRAHRIIIDNQVGNVLLLDYAVYDDGGPEPTPTTTSQAPYSATLTVTATNDIILSLDQSASRASTQSRIAIIISSAIAGLSLLANAALFMRYRRDNRHGRRKVRSLPADGGVIRMSRRTSAATDDTDSSTDSTQVVDLLPNTTLRLPANTVTMMVDQRTIRIVPTPEA